MIEPRKPKGRIRVHYVYPPKGQETSPFQITLEQVKKYASDKPLRRGPERENGTDAAGGAQNTDRPEGEKPSGEERSS